MFHRFGTIASLRVRAARTIQRKLSDMHVRPTSVHKVVQNRSDGECAGTDSPRARECGVAHDERVDIPKTCINLAGGWETYRPRRESFTSKSVGTSKTVRLISPLSSYRVVDRNFCKLTEDKPINSDRNNSAAILPSHGHGDSVRVHSADVLVQQPQQGQRQKRSEESLKHAVTAAGQQDLTVRRYLDRTNQSEASLNKLMPSPETRFHRPFVPCTTHGSTLRDSSGGKVQVRSPRAPVNETSMLPMQHHGQRQQRVLPSTTDQAHGFQSSVSQEVLQRVPTMNPQDGESLKIYDSSTKPVHVEQPAVETCDTSYHKHTSASHEIVDEQQSVANVGQAAALRNICAIDAVTQQEETMQQRKQQKQLHELQLGRQCFNREAPSNVETLQNAQKMYQQMRNNMIHQRQMQQKVLSEQQRIVIEAQQRMESQPPINHVRMPVRETLPNPKFNENLYIGEKTYTGPLLDADQGSRLILPQRVYVNQNIPIPHHEMLIRQRNARNQKSEISPQNAWSHNHQIVDTSSCDANNLSQLCIPPYDALQYKKSTESIHAHYRLTDDQRIVKRQARGHGQEIMPCLARRCETAVNQCSPSRGMDQTSDPMSRRRYSTTEQERHGSAGYSEMPAVHAHRSGQCQQKQPLREDRPMSKDQQLGVLQTLDRFGTRSGSLCAEKKYSEFTPAMLRDQELLVSNMRQQMIPEDIMRRQFNALIDEQRRHLAFVDQRESAKMKNVAILGAKPRISIKDQPPHWMEEITPARITVQQEQAKRSENSSSLRVAGRDREQPCRLGSERTERCARTEQETTMQRPSNISRHTMGLRHEELDSNDMDVYRPHRRQVAVNRKCNTRPPPYPMYNNRVPHRFMSSPQVSSSGPQQEHTLSSGRTYILNNQGQNFPEQLYRGSQQLPLHRQHSTSQQYNRQPFANSQGPPKLEQYALNDGTLQGDRANGSRCRDAAITEQQQQDSLLKCDRLTSLLKLREYEKRIRSQRQNNGLQDAETVLEKLKEFHSPDTEKGLKYVVDSGKKVRAVIKLNGTQDPSELRKLPPPPVEYLQKIQRSERPKVTANGLCNTRNADNPVPPPKSFAVRVCRIDHRSSSDGYPRQCRPGNKLPANDEDADRRMEAEKENGSTAAGTAQLQPAIFNDSTSAARTSPMITQHARDVVSIAKEQENQAVLQCSGVQPTSLACNNAQPEIRYPIIIGGLTYLARDVNSIQNQSLTGPNTFIANKFPQPLVSSN